MTSNGLRRASAWLPAAEFIDRYLACRTKAARLSIALNDPTNQLAVWMTDHLPAFEALVSSHPAIQPVVDELFELHGRMWDLEVDVRAPEVGERVFAALARQIFALNSQRHILRDRLDTLTGSATFGVRTYDEPAASRAAAR